MGESVKPVKSKEEFQHRIQEVQNKIGKKMLTDDDLLTLTCQKIVRTYTFEEKGYK